MATTTTTWAKSDKMFFIVMFLTGHFTVLRIIELKNITISFNFNIGKRYPILFRSRIPISMLYDLLLDFLTALILSPPFAPSIESIVKCVNIPQHL